MFNKEKVLRAMESLRLPNGAFIASPTPDYRALWIRDTLYATMSYWYLGEFEKLKEGVWLVCDLFKKHRRKIKTRIASPIDVPGGMIHAKYNPETLEEIVADDEWAHHQLDALGLFLHTVADLDFKNIQIIRNSEDLEIIQLLVSYLRSVEYWQRPDFGMWEECKIRHSSSIGAVVAGLKYVRKQELAVVPDPLIQLGEETLREILPYESRDACIRPHHTHDCDVAQLSLVWPYHVITKSADAEEIIRRISEGHDAENGEHHRLLQPRGLTRYWGDDYYRSTEGAWRGVSAEWPIFKFWISLVYSQHHEYEKALAWFEKASKDITRHMVPEAYQNGKPNDHTPLAWAHAIALIAFTKLPQDLQEKVSK